MGYIPEDAEWYIAELVMEIRVHGAQRNILHRNLFLLNADSPEEAYDKAVRTGRAEETEYINPKDQIVNIRFRGVCRLDVVCEPLVDGAELSFDERQGVSESEILRMIPPKGKLDVFTAPTPGKERDPDYRSKVVVEKALSILGERKK
jgi:hypothetical protein